MQTADGIAELLRLHNPDRSLDRRFYTDPDIYALELERIVMRSWFLAGHESEIRQPGDFLLHKVANETAIVVRSPNGGVSAFANVCRHRGSLICLEQSGSVRKFECPYHGWTYDIDGNLIAARSMPDDFDKSAHALNRVSVETAGGFIFVAFAPDPPSLQPARKNLSKPLKMFDTENLKVAARKHYPIAANWKLAVENYMECYHCANAHPDYARMHTLMLDPKRRDRIQGRMQERFADCGIEPYEVDRGPLEANADECFHSYWRVALFEGYKTGSRNGEPVAPLLGELRDYDGGASDFCFGPFSYLLAYSDHIVAYVFTPLDGRNCACEVFWLVRGDAIEGKDFDLDELTWLWDTTTLLDEKIIVNNWKGINSRFYKPGPFSTMEDWEQDYTRWIVNELRRDP
ncbi:MAG: aromatic ring-hydroxylating dioxygenase subunit alpha [Gammaproteobacteria bacterium]|nr:aromatic ring-hydroxylating dioxygenase subunit alpha [Gammaproteobacteria bacterium]